MIVDERHSLFVGMVWGLAMRQGIDAHPKVDEDGHYTDELVIHSVVGGIDITVIVPPPPADWTAQDWLDRIGEVPHPSCQACGMARQVGRPGCSTHFPPDAVEDDDG